MERGGKEPPKVRKYPVIESDLNGLDAVGIVADKEVFLVDTVLVLDDNLDIFDCGRRRSPLTKLEIVI